MLFSIITQIKAGIAAALIFVAGLMGANPEPLPVGTDLPEAIAVFETSLAAPIQASSTSLTLTSNSVRGGETLSGYHCFTIDEGSAQAEFVCGTVSGTSVTSLERGLSYADGETQDSDLKFSHRRGAPVSITDFPLLQRLKLQNAGEGTYEAPLSYAPGVTPTGGDEIADVDYVLSAITGTSTLSYNRIIVSATAGETVATGTVVYLKRADSRWYKVDTDDTSTFIDQEIGLTQGSGTSGASIVGGVLTYGLDSTQVGLTVGGFVFASSTAGATSTATSTQILGKAISATTMFFDQSLIDSAVYVPTTFSATTTFSNAVIGLASSTVRYYTASSTWTKPTSPTFKHAVFEMVAGGGYGGDTAATDAEGAGGGACGAYAKFMLSASQLPSTIFVHVGAAATNTTIGVINSTIITGFATATAGTKGAAASGSGNGSDGGVGGSLTASSAIPAILAINGNDGAPGFGNGTSNGMGGSGCSTPLGIGGGGPYTPTSAEAGRAASGYGSGGGGGATSEAVTGSGGVGANGIVIVTEYF